MTCSGWQQRFINFRAAVNVFLRKSIGSHSIKNLASFSVENLDSFVFDCGIVRTGIDSGIALTNAEDPPLNDSSILSSLIHKVNIKLTWYKCWVYCIIVYETT